MQIKENSVIAAVEDEDEEEEKDLVPLPHRPQPISVIEPSYMQEFREISSQYEIDEKDDSAQISS